MVVYLKLNKENLFNNDYKVTLYTIFLTAKLARLTTQFTLFSLSRNSQLTVFSLSRLAHSVLSNVSTLTAFFLIYAKFVIHTRIHTLSVLDARPGGLAINSSPRPNFLYFIIHHLEHLQSSGTGKSPEFFPELAHPTYIQGVS